MTRAATRVPEGYEGLLTKENCDKDTAIETFKKAVIEKYPDLAE